MLFYFDHDDDSDDSSRYKPENAVLYDGTPGSGSIHIHHQELPEKDMDGTYFHEEVQGYDDDTCCELCDEPIDEDGGGHTRDCPNSEDYEEYD